MCMYLCRVGRSSTAQSVITDMMAGKIPYTVAVGIMSVVERVGVRRKGRRVSPQQSRANMMRMMRVPRLPAFSHR